MPKFNKASHPKNFQNLKKLKHSAFPSSSLNTSSKKSDPNQTVLVLIWRAFIILLREIKVWIFLWKKVGREKNTNYSSKDYSRFKPCKPLKESSPLSIYKDSERRQYEVYEMDWDIKSSGFGEG